MVSNYIDLVVAAYKTSAPLVFKVPAWNHLKPGDLIYFGETQYEVVCSQTVSLDSEECTTIPAAAGLEHPLPAEAYFKRTDINWPEDTPDESAAE